MDTLRYQIKAGSQVYFVSNPVVCSYIKFGLVCAVLTGLPELDNSKV